MEFKKDINNQKYISMPTLTKIFQYQLYFNGMLA